MTLDSLNTPHHFTERRTWRKIYVTCDHCDLKIVMKRPSWRVRRKIRKVLLHDFPSMFLDL